MFLEISQNSQENTYVRVSFLIKLQACDFIKKETLAQLFSCEFCEISKKSGKIQAPNQKIKIEIQNSKQQTKNHKHNLKFTNYAFYHINYHTNYHAIITQIIAHIKFTNYKFKPPTSKLKVKSPEKSAFIIQK